MSLYSSNLKTLDPGESTQPYKHATKLFVADTFRLAPKQTFLYYVVFEVDPSQTELGSGILTNALEFVNRYERLENGLLVKDIELPKFSVGVKTLNAYNRKNIVQTNINYDPINVTFHDDAANVITRFWNDYYTYYYRDSDYTTPSYGIPEKYNRRSLSGWGYSPRNGSTKSFLKSIRIFSLHNKKFTEYYLVNPIINSWRHGRHENLSNTGIMENTMTVSYETVKYFTGFINPVSVDGFSLLHYDNQKSPIAGNFLDDFDALDALNAVDSAPKDLRKPDGSGNGSDVVGNILTAIRTYQNLKNINVNTAGESTIAAVGASVLNNVVNGSVAFPTDASNSTAVGVNNTNSNTIAADSNKIGTVTIAGVSSGVQLSSSAKSGIDAKLLTDYSRGITTSLSGTAPVSGVSTTVYDLVSTNGSIIVDPSSMLPSTGTYSAYVVDSTGKEISQYQVAGSTNRSYNSNDPSLNLVYTQLTTDASGNDISISTYQDGTIVTFDQKTGNTLNVKSGSDVWKELGYTRTDVDSGIDTRMLVAAGREVSSTDIQRVINPTTGVISAVGGIATARVVDAGTVTGSTVGGAIGGKTGAVAGALIGRALTTEIATRTGDQIGRAVTGGINPILDKITGEIRQGVDNFTGAIKNVVGSWTGVGGFNPSAPFENAISTVYNSDGSIITTFKNGDVVRFDDQYGPTIITRGSSTAGLQGFFNRSLGENVDSTGISVGAGYGSVWTDGSGNPILTGDNSYILSGDTEYLGSGPSIYDSFSGSSEFDVDLDFGGWSW